MIKPKIRSLISSDYQIEQVYEHFAVLRETVEKLEERIKYLEYVNFNLNAMIKFCNNKQPGLIDKILNEYNILEPRMASDVRIFLT